MHTIEISWNHGNVDRAIRKLIDGVAPEARGDALPRALDEVSLALSKLFRSELAASNRATELFGADIDEVDELIQLRGELLGLLNSILDADDKAGAVEAFVDAFDRYRTAEWQFLRSYSGLMTPGTEGA